MKWKGLPCSSVGKESACSAGDPGLIPALGRSPGEWIGHPLQYSWASLVAQLVENPSVMQETWVQSLGGEDPPEKGRLPSPVFWPGEFMDCVVHGVSKTVIQFTCPTQVSCFTHLSPRLPIVSLKVHQWYAMHLLLQGTFSARMVFESRLHLGTCCSSPSIV